MTLIADDSLFLTASLPQFRRLDFRRCSSSQLHCQQQSQSEQRGLAIGILAASFGGKSGNSGGLMNQLNCSFNLVAVLSSRAAVTTGAQQTVGQQLLGRQAGWVMIRNWQR